MILRYHITKHTLIKDFLDKKLSSNLIVSINLYGMYIVNNQQVKNYYPLKPGDTLEVVLPKEDSDNIKAIKGNLDILYEDIYLLILNKPDGLATLPTGVHYNNSLANIVAGYFARMGIESGIHFVNRLDLPTTGIIVLAKNSLIAGMMKDAILSKKYLLVVNNHLSSGGMIEGGIYKEDDMKRKFTKDFINSKTVYDVVMSKNKQSLVVATLLTGKTHQLRLHFSSIGAPIKGDKMYGDDQSDKLYLHSYYLEFIHPITNEKIVIVHYPKWYDQTKWYQ